MEGVGTLIRIGIHTLMKHEEEDTMQKKQKKQASRLPNTRNIAKHMWCMCRYLLYFDVFAVFWCFVDRYFDSFTTLIKKFFLNKMHIVHPLVHS